MANEPTVTLTIKADVSDAIQALDDARKALCRFVGASDDTPLDDAKCHLDEARAFAALWTQN